MSARGRWIAGAVAALVVLLFGGQWLADFLAERWWAASLIPEAGGFTSGIKLLRLTIEAAAIFLAAAWYTGHLLVVHRAIDSVQISRQVANLEIREQVTPGTLLPLAVAIGAGLGLVVGFGAGADWPVFALAWHGVSYGINDPLLHRDLGVFVAQLPLWELLHRFARLLAWSGLALAGVLYTALGALRWQRGRLAISDHARRHLGLGLGAAALVLAWGCLLDPALAAAGRTPTPAEWRVFELAALGLTGASLAAAAISAAWAVRGHHLLMAAGWTVLAASFLVVQLLLPGPTPPAEAELPDGRASLDRIAWALDGIGEEVATAPPGDRPGLPSLWTRAAVGRMVLSDSQVLEAAAPAAIPAGGSSAPVWVALRARRGEPPAVLAIADGRVGPGGAPLSYRAGDSLAYPGLVTFATLGAGSSRPGAPRLLVDEGPYGVDGTGFLRRLVLAWALQSGELLGPVAEGSRVRWNLVPRARLEHLAPFVEWDEPRALPVGGTVTWVAYGYLESAYLPGSTRVESDGAELGTLEAGVIGTVDAETGATAIFLAPDAGPLSRSWAAIAQGVVRPPGELPAAIAQVLFYPPRLFDAQSRALERGPWEAGTVPGAVGDPRVAPTTVWDGGLAPQSVLPFVRGDEARVRTLLIGRVGPRGRRLTLLRLGDAGSLPNPAAAQATWDRFPSYAQMLDSVSGGGQRFERGPYRVLPGGDASVAYQPWYAVDPRGRVTQPYIAVAQGARAGAGRSFADAWENLRGTGAPLPPGLGPRSALDEARAWMLRADSALRAGDWEAFGRAFGAVREVLGVPSDSR